MTPPKGIKGQQVQVETHKPGAQRLLLNNRCVAPRAYEKAILAIKKQCPDIGSRLYLTSGFRTEYRMVKGTPQSRRVANRCAQAEFFSPGEPNIKLNRSVLKCIKRSAVSGAVGDIQNGKKVLSALKTAVDDSIPSLWEQYKEAVYIIGGLIFTAILFMFGAPWAARRFFGGHGGGPMGGAAAGNQAASQTAPAKAPAKEAAPAEAKPAEEPAPAERRAHSPASRFLSGAQGYLAQRKVQADIRSVTVASAPTGVMVPAGHVVVSMNRSLYFMPIKGIAMPRIGVRVNVSALRLVPIRVRIR